MKLETLTKIKELLANEGLEEEKIDTIVQEIESAEEGETPKDEGENDTPTEEVPASDPVPPVTEEGGVDEGATEVPIPNPEEVPPVEDGAADVPPVDEGVVPGSIEDALGSLLPPEGEVPPTDVPPAIPPIDSSQIQELVNQIDEQKKAIDGLLARISSLEEALNSAGVIEGSNQTQLGDERPSLPRSEENEASDLLSGILRTINGKN